MSLKKTLTVHSTVLLDIHQLKKGKRLLFNAILYRFKKNFERFKFGDLSAWHEMEGFRRELEMLQAKFAAIKHKLATRLPFDRADLKKYQSVQKKSDIYTLHSRLDTHFLECLECMDEVFALLELALIQNLPESVALNAHKNALKHYCFKKLMGYVYQTRKPSFYMGNYCQSSPAVRQAMLERIDMTFETFHPLVSENSLGLLSEPSKHKLLNCSTY